MSLPLPIHASSRLTPLKQSAVVIPVRSDGKVLLLRRGPTDLWKPGCWNFPGGKVDPSEPVWHGAQRELLEEAGLWVRRSSLKELFSYVEGDRKVHIFTAPVLDTAVTMTDGEHDMFVWTYLNQLPYPVIPSLPAVVKAVLALRKHNA